MSNQLFTNYDFSKIFIWDNRFEPATYTNDTASDVTILAGTLMGRVAATNKVVPLQSNATDGSQFPVGINQETQTVEAYSNATLSICIGGDVAKEKIIFVKVGDTFTTIVSSRTLGDRIAGDTLGIKAVPGQELTGYDNA